MDRRKSKMTNQQDNQTVFVPKEDNMVLGIDRIGELPDSLLIYILCLLDDMKDAVKTDLLSKRWKHLWTNLDTLVYNCDIENPSKKKLKRFMLFVDKTLMQCKSPKIKKFSVTGIEFYEKVSPSVSKLVHKWVKFVVKKNVQDVKLELKGLDYVIPVSFFRNSSFVTLEIDEVGKLCSDGDENYPILVSMESDLSELRYRKTFDVSWSMLRSLSLKCVYLDKDFVNEIFIGCPVLETLILDDIGGLPVLDITSPSVRNVRVVNLEYNIADNSNEFDIIAPWVEKLEVSGCFDEVECNLVSVPSLKSASLTLNYSTFEHRVNNSGLMLRLNTFAHEVNEYFEDDSDNESDRDEEPEDVWYNMIDCLLHPVRNVDELVVGSELLQALSMSKLFDREPLILNCKSVKLQLPICIHEVPGILSLLESSPNLETLVIKLMPWRCHFSTYRNVGDNIYTKYMEEVFSSFNGIEYLSEQKGKFKCLKNVKIDCTEKLYSIGDKKRSSKNMCFEFKVVAHIIKNAPVLEKLVILSSRSDCPDFSTPYIALMSSKDEVGDKAAGWDLKETKSTCEFCFC